LQTFKRENVLEKLTTYKIVPVIRADSQEIALDAVTTLQAAGFQTAEITMTVPGAIELIKQFSKLESMLLIGAGTVTNLKNAEECISAGAKYIISPFIVDGLPELCDEAGVLCIMSGLTPTEVHTAWKRGSAAVKVFPAGSMGGPSHIKALKTVLPKIPLIPTGGVNLTNINQYLHAGASFVGVGSDLVNTCLLKQGDFDGVAKLGKSFLEAIK
jgi:2-dehydro-3-deoxyphosphogluconate aldolase / (4S)-4-hydroxy-2-oxoglutarate aldolase